MKGNMSKHLFGLIVTPFGTAANNRGESEGNITTLQKLLWNGSVHTTVSAEAIRGAIRYSWQARGLPLNRNWNEDKTSHSWKDPEFTESAKEYVDDDVLGFMSAQAAKEEGNVSGSPTKKGRIRRSRLEVTRAISLTPWSGDMTFNAASIGATPSASKKGQNPVPYGTEVHATRYQYGFAMTPEHLEKKERALEVVDAIISLSQVAGNQSRFLYDFSPEAIVFRWTDDFAPRILYGFTTDGSNSLHLPTVEGRVEAGDINPKELFIGGPVAGIDGLKQKGAFVSQGVKAAADEVKSRIRKDLGLK